MKKLELSQMEEVQGGASGWSYYAASCGAATAFLEASWLGGPAIFGANAIYVSTCALLLPIAGASHKF